MFGLAGACLSPCGKLPRADLQCAELDLAERQITVQRIVQLAVLPGQSYCMNACLTSPLRAGRSPTRG